MKLTEDIDRLQPEDIPEVWVYNADYTMYKLVSLILRQYLNKASSEIEIPREEEVEIESLIDEAEKLSEDITCDEARVRAHQLFCRLGKIIPNLWY